MNKKLLILPLSTFLTVGVVCAASVPNATLTKTITGTTTGVTTSREITGETSGNSATKSRTVTETASGFTANKERTGPYGASITTTKTIVLPTGETTTPSRESEGGDISGTRTEIREATGSEDGSVTLSKIRTSPGIIEQNIRKGETKVETKVETPKIIGPVESALNPNLTGDRPLPQLPNDIDRLHSSEN